MNKLTIASLFVATSFVLPTQFANAIEVSPQANDIITTATDAGLQLEEAIAELIAANPNLAAELTAAAIAIVGSSSDQVETLISNAILAIGVDAESMPELLQAMADERVDPDTITGLAVALGVDPTIASGFTAAGGITNPLTAVSRGGNGGTGGGGGAPDISETNN